MPTYQYVCEKCGQHFDKFQSITERPLALCPKDLCARKRWGKGRVKRVISGGAGLLFKGNGFYITDYRSEGYKEAAKKETAAGKPAGGDGKAAAADSRPAPAKTDAKPHKAESKAK